jgi:hypothetical protein
MEQHESTGSSAQGRKVARRASPVLAVVALAWVLRKLLSRSKD